MAWIERNGLLVPDTVAEARADPMPSSAPTVTDLPLADERALLESLRDLSVQQLQILGVIAQALTGRPMGRQRAGPVSVVPAPIDPVILARSLFLGGVRGAVVAFFGREATLVPAGQTVTIRRRGFPGYDMLVVGQARFTSTYHDLSITVDPIFDGQRLLMSAVPLTEDFSFEFLPVQYLNKNFSRHVYEKVFVNGSSVDVVITSEAFHAFIERSLNQNVIIPAVERAFGQLRAFVEGSA